MSVLNFNVLQRWWDNIVLKNFQSAILAAKTITANGTYDPADDDLDGYSSVTVNVTNADYTEAFTALGAEAGSGTTPLTDAIDALTAYSNETTGESDSDLSAAVATLVTGYGSGGGGGGFATLIDTITVSGINSVVVTPTQAWFETYPQVAIVPNITMSSSDWLYVNTVYTDAKATQFNAKYTMYVTQPSTSLSYVWYKGSTWTMANNISQTSFDLHAYTNTTLMTGNIYIYGINKED